MSYVLSAKEQLNFHNPLPLDGITPFARKTRIRLSNSPYITKS